MPEKSRRSLFVRLDRIGDLVLTLPVDEIPPFTERNLHWLVPDQLAFIPRLAEPARNFTGWTQQKNSWQNFWHLFHWLKEQRFDEAIVFHAPWWVGAALLLAGVPLRVGVRSQWHSFLFFNRGIRQKRSQALKNERDYNFDLLSTALGVSLPKILPSLKLNAKAVPLDRHKLPEKYVVVHPGMAGSARNWTTENYIETVRQLIAFTDVVITGTKGDLPWVEPIRTAFGSEKRVYFLDQRLNGEELVAVLQRAQAVLAPSTGVIHLAASTGVYTLGIYSPIRVQSATRWGPKGDRVETLSPEVECPGAFSCLMENCEKFDCMKQISVEQVVAKIRGALK